MPEFQLISEAGGNALCVVALLECIKKIYAQYNELRGKQGIKLNGFANILFAVLLSFAMPYMPDPLKNGLVTAGFSVFGYQFYKGVLDKMQGPKND
jgi:hypothetical protein